MTVFYTLHGKDDYPKHRSGRDVGCIADDFGLTGRLGFRPRWCSGLYEDSLADSWFAIWAASPHYVEEISFIKSERAVPIDAHAWTQVRQKHMDAPVGEPGWLDEFERIFDVEGVPRWRLEYLVPDDQENTITIPAAILSYPGMDGASDGIAAALGLDDDMSRMLAESFKSIGKAGDAQARLQGMELPFGIETAYRLNVQLSGMPSLLWSIGIGDGFNFGLLDITVDDLAHAPGSSYDKTQMLMQRWDTEPESFSADDFDEMYNLFVKAIGDAAETACLREMSDVGRNEPCPCGSGKKFKKCHGTRHDVDWYVGSKK